MNGIERAIAVARAAALSVFVAACASTAGQSRPAAAPEHEEAHAGGEHPPAPGHHEPTDASAPTESEIPMADAHRHDHAAAGALSEQEAYGRARPVFQQYCAICHTRASNKRGALRHFSMDTYPFGGHHADQMATTIREVLGTTGKRATMPRDRPGIVQGEELRLVLDWADAFDRAHPAAPAHQHGGHDH